MKGHFEMDDCMGLSPPWDLMARTCLTYGKKNVVNFVFFVFIFQPQ